MSLAVRASPAFPPLVCPLHHDILTAADEALACAQGHRFPVRLGIPRVVVSATDYTDAFGEQWNTYRATQLDSYTGATISRDRLMRCVGDALWRRLHDDASVQVLEAGCGAGRFTEVLLRCRATVLTSTDLSSAVEANQQNFPQTERHRIVQCDIYRLPFPERSYDVVLCLGVLQHTPDPEAAMARLYAQVRPGGWLAIDQYAPSLAHFTKVSALLLRPVLKRLPPRVGTAVTERLTRMLFPLHRAVRNHRRLQAVLSRVSPLLTYFRTYPQLDDRLQLEWAKLDTHDSLTDYYKHLRTPARIRVALAALGAREIWVAKGGNGVEARCRKPPEG